MKKFVLISLLFVAFHATAQVIDPIKWNFSSTRSGNDLKLIFKASMEKGWHLYDTGLPEGGPISTQFIYEDSTRFEVTGQLQKSPAPIEKFDNTFKMNLRYFSDTVVFTQLIRLKDNQTQSIKGYVTFMGCNEESCLPPNEVPFQFSVADEKGEVPAAGKTADDVPVVSGTQGQGQSFWLFILISFLAGLAAILTPCVFPMIPMTVSFFMRSTGTGKTRY